MTKPMTSDSEEQCAFCKRIKNEEYDDRYANHVMFEPLNPVTDGHMLVVPIPHTPHLNAGGLEAGQTGWALRYFTNDLDQYNIITSKGSDATQTIQHLHFHIVPRTKDDGLKLPWSGQHTDGHANAEPLRELAQEAQSEAPSVDEELIDLIDKYFPKGECKERGSAIVMLYDLVTWYEAKINRLIAEAYNKGYSDGRLVKPKYKVGDISGNYKITERFRRVGKNTKYKVVCMLCGAPMFRYSNKFNLKHKECGAIKND